MSIYYDRHKKDAESTAAWVERPYINGIAQPTTAKSISWTPKEFKGQTTPNFYAKKRRGDLIPHTAYNHFEQSVAVSNGEYQQISSGTDYKVAGMAYMAEKYHITQMEHAPDMTRANYMVQQAAASIAQEGWDALTFAGELPSLRRMFSTTARRIYRLAKNPRGFGFKSVKDLHSAWLEGRYGWRTLAYDVRDLNHAVREWDHHRLIWTKRSGYGDYHNGSFTDVENWAAGDMLFSITDHTEHSVRGSVAAHVQPDRVSVDPFQTSWELVPYSFVVDWVFDVGTFLAASRLIAQSKARTASIGVKTVRERTAVASVSSTNPGYSSVTWSGDRYYSRITTLSRHPTVIPIRPLLTGRAASPEMILDLQGLSKVRSHTHRHI